MVRQRGKKLTPKRKQYRNTITEETPKFYWNSEFRKGIDVGLGKEGNLRAKS